MARRRRRSAGRHTAMNVGLIVAIAAVVWLAYPRGEAPPGMDVSRTLVSQEPPESDPFPGPIDDQPTESSSQPPVPLLREQPNLGPETTSVPTQAPPSVTAKPQSNEPTVGLPKPTPVIGSGGGFETHLAAAHDALEKKDFLVARRLFTEALALAPPGPNTATIREALSNLASETIFSSRVVENDPLTARYVVKTGDSLVNIAMAHKVSADFLAWLNNLPNKDLIRVGQSLKVVNGPFRALVNKSDFILDIYLGDNFVHSYSVGLGADGSTPTGEWRVGTKLKNPTYYPPRGGQILSADDPKNPLGEHWIALYGVSGEAKDQQRYGIHGTIEPDSIGKNVSMGCIRLLNEDVAAVYSYLVENHSTVIVQ